MNVRVELDKLGDMHPLLPETTASEYVFRAILGLDRHGHKPGLSMVTILDGARNGALVYWQLFPNSSAVQLDYHRITEDAAEAIALAIVHEARGWVIRRRLQRGEFADWLLLDRAQQSVALEVSGIDQGDVRDRMRQKKEQLSRARNVFCRAACVVELATGHFALETL